MQDAVRAGKDPCVWKMKLMGEGDKIRQQASTFSSVKHKGTPAPVCPACTHSSPASSQKKKRKKKVKRKEKEREWQSVSLAWPAEHHRADFIFFSSKKAEFGTFTAVMPFLESFLTRERDRERLQSQTWRPPILFAVVCVPQVIRCLTIPSQPHPPNTHILQNLVYLTATPHTTGLSLCTPQTPCQKVTTKKLWPQQWSWRSRLETSPLALEVTHLNSQHVLKAAARVRGAD